MFIGLKVITKVVFLFSSCMLLVVLYSIFLSGSYAVLHLTSTWSGRDGWKINQFSLQREWILWSNPYYSGELRYSFIHWFIHPFFCSSLHLSSYSWKFVNGCWDQCLGSNLFWCGSGSWIRDSDPGSALEKTGSGSKSFYNLSFFNSSDLGFGSNIFFLQFFVDILPLGFGSVDPHIFADPDPGSQILEFSWIRG